MIRKRLFFKANFFDFSRWWLISLATLLFCVFIFAVLWLLGPVQIYFKYTVKDLLKDGADISLKIGGLIGGILAVYKYLYRRFEPIVYYVACGLIPFSLIQNLFDKNEEFKRISKLKDWDHSRSNPLLQHCHDLPMVVLHQTDMETLKIKDGSPVDLEFNTPSGRKIWTIAYAFSYESTGKESYKMCPIALSLSLRRFFGIERPFQSHHESISEDEKVDVPEGWRAVEHNASDLAILHQSFKTRNSLVWIVRKEYTVRFKDREDHTRFFGKDNLEGEGRIMEYVGISLRVLPRNWFRYHAS